MLEAREVFLVANLAFAAVAVPLVMRRIGPNRFYGFRTPRTLADRDLWYRANAFAGRALLAAAAVGLVIAAAAPDASFAPHSPAAGLTVLPLVAAIVASFVYLRRQR